MSLLASSILTLLIGPILYGIVRKRDIMLSLMDGFIFVTITGLVTLYILPESFSVGGWLTLPFAVVGLFGPTLLEGLFRRSARKTHLAALMLGFIGLVLHALMDGAALSEHFHQAGPALLPLAVILHRFPVGLTVWWLLHPSFGARTSIGALGLIATFTVVGYSFGPVLSQGLSGQGIALFQALVAGSLLHVVFHQPHLGSDECGCRMTARGNNWYEGTGALLGVGLMAVLVSGDAGLHEEQAISNGAETFWILARESAPALLIAYLMAGMINAFLPHSSIGWMRKGSLWTQSLKGMAVGLPFPICSCGVVPLYRTLIKKGAPATAGMAFLIATPELGLDAVLISIPLLGPNMTVTRVIGAAAVAFLIGRLVGGMKDLQLQAQKIVLEDKKELSATSLKQKLRKSLKVGLGEVVDHTAPWIVLGLAIAAVAQPFLSSGWLSEIPPTLQVPLFAILGLPAYVCASGATPLVAVLIFAGVSPGAGLAFLLTGPATNLTTFGILSELHGKRVAVSFSLSIILLSVGLGYAVDLLFPVLGATTLTEFSDDGPSILQQSSLIILSAVYLFSIFRRGARRFVAEVFFQDQRALDLHPHYH